MADDAQEASPKNESSAHVEAGEDAETRAARRELKQSSISDTHVLGTQSPGFDSATDDKAARPTTPAVDLPDATNDDLKEQVSSPKKKRAHDQLDGDKQADDNDANSIASSDSAKDRASRLEPEKKRHRDAESKEDASTPLSTDTRSASERDGPAAKPPNTSLPQTSANAFAASGFGKLATGSSPFANLGASKGSAFGSPNKPALSSFASAHSAPASQPVTAAVAAAPKLSFGSGSGVSPFGGISSGANGFGSTLGGSGFGSALSGAKPLGSFAAPGTKPLKSGKPAKPFGAPDSDVEDEDDEDEDAGDNESDPDEAERVASLEKETEEKKKTKLHRIEVNDGEAGEATVVSVRAKMFYHDKEAGWKERGAGMLKINSPQGCVDFDDAGAVVPGSFDASGLEVDEEEAGGEHKVVRLIMRQDQTHRVILNTAILPAMKFQEKTSLKSVGILFTAFEGEEAKPVSITMRLSAANAKVFLNEISIIQRELQNC